LEKSSGTAGEASCCLEKSSGTAGETNCCLEKPTSTAVKIAKAWGKEMQVQV